MTCKKIQNILFSVKTEELDPGERVLLEKHLAGCENCRAVFETISRADRMLSKVKATVPRIRNEHALTESILTSLLKEGNTEKPSMVTILLDRLSDIFYKRTVRFACSALILFCGLTYVVMEYQDMKAIVNLEQQMGRRVDFNQANLMLPGNYVLRFLSDYYKLLNGNSSYVEITNSLVLMKKKDVLTLMNDYRKLDTSTRRQLDELQDEFLKERSLEFGSSAHREEMNALQSEIERLKIEFDKINQKERQQ
jgi:hypothetical protein